MPNQDFSLAFPASFVWGVATSAYQIEGAAAVDGRGPSIWDTFTHTEGKIIDGTNGDIGCDHYHRYAEDVELIASLNVDSYRFSIAWPRVQPDGAGAWNEAGFAFYDRLLAALAEKNIAAHVTLYHWDLPQALQDKGGWLNRATAYHFAEYAAEVARRFGSRAASIATHNEPWCTAVLGHGTGQFAPGMSDPVAALQVSHHLLLSHGLAMQAMRATGASAPLGIVLNQWTADPATDSAEDKALAELEYARSVQWYMDPIFKGHYPALALKAIDEKSLSIFENDFNDIRQPLDFLGINYYTRAYVSSETPARKAPAPFGLTDMGWEIYPQGLTELLVGLHREYKLPPVYITENGVAVADKLSNGAVADSQRIAYLRMHLAALNAAMAQGVDVRGYFYWSLMDNFEWNSGFAKRFGLVYVDYGTLERTPKESAIWYREFIARQKREAKAPAVTIAASANQSAGV
jgi:beta-glucosidase